MPDSKRDFSLPVVGSDSKRDFSSPVVGSTLYQCLLSSFFSDWMGFGLGQAAASLGHSMISIVNKLHAIFAQLRSQTMIELSQLAVIGSLSSGKSSVLEALVGLDFLLGKMISACTAHWCCSSCKGRGMLMGLTSGKSSYTC
ncbi:dynamin-related 3A-like [Olea europaea subsp. europaea]|uniref:Dynamin-related 3A-like n=1 Tax=Olea europaea subsp. europaea TaxID=158383 RepID=A0A8S0TBA7_OLEEU|nr:dynamin-related 3A-like [Olea europaea subsp. europaea]